MGLWGFGMIGLGDRVKVTKRGARKDGGKVVKLSTGTNDVTVEYDDGQQVTVRIGDTQGTRK
jgi:hypothetical protein